VCEREREYFSAIQEYLQSEKNISRQYQQYSTKREQNNLVSSGSKTRRGTSAKITILKYHSLH
jgi:hypothetical protein